MPRAARSIAAAFVILTGCTGQSLSGVDGNRVFEERSGAWPKLSKVTLCDNGRFSIQTAVEVNSDVGTFVQEAPQASTVTGTASGASTTFPNPPIMFHYAIAFGQPNVLSSDELGGSWQQLEDSKSLERASSTCELVATFKLP